MKNHNRLLRHLPQYVPNTNSLRYGSWMLVTRKNKVVDPYKNQRKPRRKEPTSQRNNNQFGVLEGEIENAELTRKSKPRGKKSKDSGESGKGKSSTLPSPSQTSRPPPLPKQTEKPSGNCHSSDSNGRNHGGPQMVVRNKSRGSSRGDSMNHHSAPLTNVWFGNVQTNDLFQFGESQAIPFASSPTNHHTFDVGNTVRQLSRLDRVLWNIQLTFPEAKAVVLPRLYSDHNPVLFIYEVGSPPDRYI
nr:LINE-type retrotransposon LIb DNA [Ipomoea batatas]GME12087.1 LINE-type retrotransposon LIb DNA [Ipomoea batatas]